MSDNVMPREEVRKMFFGLVAAIFANKEPPALESSYKYIRREDIDVVTDEMMRMLSEHFNKIPEHFSENFELQETVQQKIDETVSELVFIVKSQFDLLGGE